MLKEELQIVLSYIATKGAVGHVFQGQNVTVIMQAEQNKTFLEQMKCFRFLHTFKRDFKMALILERP